MISPYLHVPFGQLFAIICLMLSFRLLLETDNVAVHLIPPVYRIDVWRGQIILSFWLSSLLFWWMNIARAGEAPLVVEKADVLVEVFVSALPIGLRLTGRNASSTALPTLFVLHFPGRIILRWFCSFGSSYSCQSRVNSLMKWSLNWCAWSLWWGFELLY